MLRPRDSVFSVVTPPASAAARLVRLLAVEAATATDVLPTVPGPEEEDELPVDIARKPGPCLGLRYCLSCVCVHAICC